MFKLKTKTIIIAVVLLVILLFVFRKKSMYHVMNGLNLELYNGRGSQARIHTGDIVTDAFHKDLDGGVSTGNL